MNYIKTLIETLKKVDFKKLDIISDWLTGDQTICIIGNGGSAATAEHLACDLNNIGYSAIALTSVPTLTAFGNDFGYEHTFDKQIKNLIPDVTITISASGNSRNIIEAVKTANKFGCTTISFTGFDGGELKDLSDININVPIKNYEIVEDIHLTICHMLKCKLKKE